MQRYEFSVIDCCCLLAQRDGGSLECGYTEVLQAYDFLTYRLETWQDSNMPRLKKYEELVKQMVSASLDLWNERIPEIREGVNSGKYW